VEDLPRLNDNFIWLSAYCKVDYFPIGEHLEKLFTMSFRYYFRWSVSSLQGLWGYLLHTKGVAPR